MEGPIWCPACGREHCPHKQRQEIAPPQTNVENGRLLETRSWFCNDCGGKWTTTKKLGDVDSIELRVNLK
jgi:hypothetical protein